MDYGQALAMGQQGSIHVAGTDAVTAPSGKVFIAIQFLETTVFDSAATGLAPPSHQSQLFPSSNGASTDIDDSGAVVDGEAFPQGITIYGKWSGFELASGRVIAYLGT